jgi:hypothetical protein
VVRLLRDSARNGKRLRPWSAGKQALTGTGATERSIWNVAATCRLVDDGALNGGSAAVGGKIEPGQACPMRQK